MPIAERTLIGWLQAVITGERATISSIMPQSSFFLRPFWQNYPSFDGLNDLTKAIFTKSDSQTDSKQRCGMLLLFVVLIARTISRKE